MDFTFDPEQAAKYGVHEAVVIRVIAGWIHKNRTDNKNQHDGRTWTYNTVAGWREHFPFWSVDQMRGVIENLKKKGVLMVGNYNKTTWDRTVWYAFIDEAIWLPSRIHLGNLPNGSGEKTETIPEELTKPLKKPKEEFPQDSQPLVLATFLLTEHKTKHDQKFLAGKEAATAQRWAKDIDKLIRIDKRTPDEIRRVILWCQTPGCFWASNILSGAKLREKFATLVGQASGAKIHSKLSATNYDPNHPDLVERMM